MNYLWAAIIGLGSGITSGLFGVGGGIVMVPAMLLLLHLPRTHVAVGTSLAVIVPTALVSVWQHARAGNVSWSTAAMLVPTALLGGVVGVRLAAELSSDQLRRAFAVFLIVVGFWLLLRK